jgi:hypothetical protein
MSPFPPPFRFPLSDRGSGCTAPRRAKSPGGPPDPKSGQRLKSPRLTAARSVLVPLPLRLLTTVWQPVCRVGKPGPKILETLHPMEIPHA